MSSWSESHASSHRRVLPPRQPSAAAASACGSADGTGMGHVSSPECPARGVLSSLSLLRQRGRSDRGPCGYREAIKKIPHAKVHVKKKCFQGE